MGIGDEIMAAGDARRQFLDHGRRVEILDRHGQRRWHPMWEGLEYIASPGQQGKFTRMQNGPGCRPYHLAKEPTRWRFNLSHRAQRAEIRFTSSELDFAERYRGRIILEPNIKAKAPPGKQWGRWDDLVGLLAERGERVAQMGAAGAARTDGLEFIDTPTFRHAAAVLSVSRAAVLPEGGLHHAAAAVGLRAIVIFGGFTPVEVTGYDLHINLGATGEDACGSRVECEHCRKWMASIEPVKVMRALTVLL